MRVGIEKWNCKRIETVLHYTSEIKHQAKVFKNNFNRINDYEKTIQRDR